MHQSRHRDEEEGDIKLENSLPIPGHQKTERECMNTNHYLPNLWTQKKLQCTKKDIERKKREAMARKKICENINNTTYST